MRKIGITAIVVMFLVAGGVACKHENDATKSQAAGQSASGIAQIDLPQFAPTNLPTAPGRDAFAVACLSCHSTRYLTVEPPPAAGKGEENVRKMKKTYGRQV